MKLPPNLEVGTLLQPETKGTNVSFALFFFFFPPDATCWFNSKMTQMSNLPCN